MNQLARYQGIQFLARTIETHSGSIQVESIRPSLTAGTLSHCSSILMSLTDTLSHIEPKPRLSITVLNLSPYKGIYLRIQIPCTNICNPLRLNTGSEYTSQPSASKLSITGLKSSSYILTSKPRSEPSNVQYRQVYDNIVNSSGKKPVLCELGATSFGFQYIPVTRPDLKTQGWSTDRVRGSVTRVRV